MTIEQERMRVLGWDGCLNVRDLGGYRTKDGRETHWGALVRADNLGQLSEGGRIALIEHGIRTIVDLRLPHEVRAHPNPFTVAQADTHRVPGAHGVSYVNISLVDPAATPPGKFTTLANDYKRIVDIFQPAIGKIMRTIARAPKGGILFHCMAGRDRTGIIAAMLLELAGVPRDTIAADYALSAECLRSWDEHWLASGPGSRADRERDMTLHAPTAEVMREVLEHLDERHGGVEVYLRVAGLTPGDIAALRDRLLLDV